MPGYEFSAWVGMLAPAATPPPVIDALHDHVVRALRTAELAARLTVDGNEVVASSPASFAAVLMAERARWARVVREAGIKLE